MRRVILGVRSCALGLILFGGLMAPVVRAATSTWDGGGADDNWTTDNNWNPDGAPANDGTADVIFGGTTRLTPNVDVDYSIHSLTFDSTASSTFTIGGNQLSVGAGGITNNSPTEQIINNDIVMTAAASFTAATGNITIGGTVDNGGNLLTVAGASNTAINNTISGAGGLTMSGTGTFTLGAANTFTGAVTLNSGTITAGAAGALPDVTYAISGGTLNLNSFDTTMSQLSGTGGTISLGTATLTVNQSASTTFSGAISGGGNFHMQGTGTLIFNGANNYTGTTTIDSGSTLQIGNGGTTGSLGTGDVTTDGTLVFNRSDAITVANNISGDMNGSLTLNGTSDVTLTGANTYSGTTLINSGTTLRVGNGGTAGTLGNGLIADQGTLSFNRSDAQTVSNIIDGTGAVTIVGTGPVTLTGSNLYTGITTINSGSTLQVGSGGTAGTLGTGNVTNSGTLVFNRSDSVTEAGAISGAGSLTQQGTGTTILSGTNNYTGGTTVSSGTLQGTTSSLQGNITDTTLNTSHVNFNQATSGTYAGVISGAGDVAVSGNGTVTFSGANTYTGNTTVSGGGTFLLNGSTTSNTTVSNTGTMGGTGIVNGDLHNSGTITPGTPGTAGGTLNVTGSFTNDANTTVQIKVDGTANNVLNVGGSTSISGGTVNVDTSSGFLINHQYTFLTSGGLVTGQFSDISASTSNFVTATLDENDHNVFFTLQSNFISAAQTQNERAVAHYFDQIVSGASGDLQTVISALDGLSNAQAAAAFEEMSGDIHPTMAQMALQDTTLVVYQVAQHIRGSVFAPGGSLSVADNGSRHSNHPDVALVGCDGDGMPIFERDDCDGPRWSGWVVGYGLGGAAKSDGNAPGINYNTGGTVAGLERWTDDCHLLGGFVGYTGTNVGTNFGPNSSINGGQFGGYAFVNDGFSYYTLLGGFEFDTLNTRRLMDFGDIDRIAQSNYNDWEGFAYLERGFCLESCNRLLQPFMALQYIYLRQNSFTETNADSIDLTAGGVTTNSLRSMLGARLQYASTSGTGHRTLPELHAMWLHEYLDATTSLTTRFVPVAGNTFTVQGLDLGRDSAMIGGSLTWEMYDGWSMYVNYDMQTNTQNTFHVGSGGLGRSW
ncbi:MAG TPA: autotransporter domain-containing protein [Pirellulales bacterium]